MIRIRSDKALVTICPGCRRDLLPGSNVIADPDKYDDLWHYACWKKRRMMGRTGFDALADLVFWSACDQIAWSMESKLRITSNSARALVLGDVVRTGWWPRYIRLEEGAWIPRWRTEKWNWLNFDWKDKYDG